MEKIDYVAVLFLFNNEMQTSKFHPISWQMSKQ